MQGKVQQNFVNWQVLIVDDERDNLDIAAQIMELNGATVHTARHGKDALTLLATLNPTLILTDLAMPCMDGHELLRAVRAIPRLAATPVLAMTAHVDLDSRKKLLAEGFDGYISKPFGIAVLVNEVLRATSFDLLRPGGVSV